MNRRTFLSVVAGLPVIGKYWKPTEACLNVSDLPRRDFNWWYDPKNPAIDKRDWNADGVQVCRCTDSRCAKHGSRCGDMASVKYWPFCFECNAVVYYDNDDHIRV